MSETFYIKKTAFDDNNFDLIQRDADSFIIGPGELNGPAGLARDSDLELYGFGSLKWGEGVDQNQYRLMESNACPAKVDGDFLVGTDDAETYIPGNPGNGSFLTAGSPALIVPKDERDLGIGNGITKPLIGQLWYNTSDSILYNYELSGWETVFKEAAGSVDQERIERIAADDILQTNLDNHAADDDLHLTFAQNILLDHTDPLLTGEELNTLKGIEQTLPLDTVQKQLADKISRTGDSMDINENLTFSGTGDVRGLTTGTPVLDSSATSRGYVQSIFAPLISPILSNPTLTGSATAVTLGTSDISTRIATTFHVSSKVNVVQNNLNNHAATLSVHLTSAQNTLLDGTSASLTGAQLNTLIGITSSVQTQLNTKISRAGDSMTSGRDLTFSGGGDVRGLDANRPETSTSAGSRAWLESTFAPIASPTLTGTPRSSTPATSDDSTRIATTGWVKDQSIGGANNWTTTGSTVVPSGVTIADITIIGGGGGGSSGGDGPGDKRGVNGVDGVNSSLTVPGNSTRTVGGGRGGLGTLAANEYQSVSRGDNRGGWGSVTRGGRGRNGNPGKGGDGGGSEIGYGGLGTTTNTANAGYHGGGGAGGWGQDSASGNGGDSGNLHRDIFAVTPGGTISWVLGSGGAGGAWSDRPGGQGGHGYIIIRWSK